MVSLSSDNIELSHPDPSLVTGQVVGARYTPVYILMITLFLLYPIFTLLAYRGTLKPWCFDKHAAARAACTPVPELEVKTDDLEKHPSYIDLEAAFSAPCLLDPDPEAGDY